MIAYMRDGKNLVTTVTEEFKTFIPKGKSRNQTEKTLWNKDLKNYSYRHPMLKKPIKTYKNYILSCIFLFFAIFPIFFPSLI